MSRNSNEADATRGLFYFCARVRARRRRAAGGRVGAMAGAGAEHEYVVGTTEWGLPSPRDDTPYSIVYSVDDARSIDAGAVGRCL